MTNKYSSKHFIEYLRDTLSSEEKEAFEASLETDSSLSEEFSEFKQVWALTQKVSAEQHKAPSSFSSKVLEAVEAERAVLSKGESMMSKFRLGNKALAGMATVCVAVLCLVSLTKTNYPSISPQADRIETEKTATEELVSNPSGSGTVITKGDSTKTKPKKQNIVATPKASQISESVSPTVEKEFQAEGNSRDKSITLKKKGRSQGKLEAADSVSMPITANRLAGSAILSEADGASPSRGRRINSSNFASPQIKQRQAIRLDDSFSRPNRESYGKFKENKFTSVKTEALSTFSIDVDTGSYSNIRRFLRSNTMPPADAVRLEEMINYFKYDYPIPGTKEQPFSVNTELGSAPWNEKHQLLKIGLKGYEIPSDELPNSNLVFLIDSSGSMGQPSKLPLLKKGLGLMLDKLTDKDSVSIVAYAGSAGLVLPPTPGNQKSQILSAFNSLSSGGSTAGGQGIQLAYSLAKDNFIKGGNNRVILATDGDFNVGVSSKDGLDKLIEEKRKSGVFLSVLGFGTGNYQEAKMESLANKGNGNYFYIDSIREAKKVLVSDLRGNILTIAKDVKIQLEFNPANVQAYRLLGYENRKLNKEDFNDDTKDAGELGAGHTVTALYELIPAGVNSNYGQVDDLKYQTTKKPKDRKVEANPEFASELLTVKLRYKLPESNTSSLIKKTVAKDSYITDKKATSKDFRFASAVAEFGMLLRDSKFKAASSYESVRARAERAKGEDKNGYRREFLELVETAELLSQ